jgi:hypothetical protein
MSFAPATAVLNHWVRILALEKEINRQSYDTWSNHALLARRWGYAFVRIPLAEFNISKTAPTSFMRYDRQPA